MRNHNKLIAFQKADELVFEIYDSTKTFPSDERFNLTSQIRRSMVSVPSNIVEGCARDSDADFLRFLYIAYGSALSFQLSAISGRPSAATSCLPKAVCRKLFAESCLPKAVCRKLFAESCLPKAVCRKLFAESCLLIADS